MGADTLRQCRCLLAAAADVLMGRLQQVEEDSCLPVQLPQLVIQVGYLQERLQLPSNAAHVLSAKDMTCVGAVLQIALVHPSHDASHIVSHMLVSHGSGIDAIINLSFRITGYPSRVHVHGHIFRTVDILQTIQGDIFDVVAHLHAVGVHIACIFAVVQRAFVASADAACIVVSRHSSG